MRSFTHLIPTSFLVFSSLQHTQAHIHIHTRTVGKQANVIEDVRICGANENQTQFFVGPHIELKMY